MPNKLKVVRGTFRGDRSRPPVVASIAGAVGRPPAWLTGAARRLWAVKVATYARCGQMVAGCEPMLAQFCALEAELVRRYEKGDDVPAALLTVYRQFAAEFFDSPASQIGRVATAAPANRFAIHIQPPPGR